VPLEDFNENSVVNGGKKLPYVTFEHPHRARMIAGHLIGIGAKLVDSFVPSFPFSTRIRGRDKGIVKKWIQFSVERMVEQAVSHVCFVDITWLGVRDIKCLIWGMSVSLCGKCLMQ
jgi:hypothetical protein